MRSANDSVRVIFSGGLSAAGAAPAGMKPRPSPAAAEPLIQLRRVALLMSFPPLTHAVLIDGIVVQGHAQTGLLRDIVKTVLHRERFFDQVILGGDSGID